QINQSNYAFRIRETKRTAREISAALGHSGTVSVARRPLNVVVPREMGVGPAVKLVRPPRPTGGNVGMGRRGGFFGLNGTLVEPLKPERLDQMTLIPGAVEAVACLSAAGFICPVVTVQSRIAKGLFSLAEFETWFAGFAARIRKPQPRSSFLFAALAE